MPRRPLLPDGRETLRHIAYVLGPARHYRPAYRHIADAIGLEEGAFLDVGCGPGSLCLEVAAGHPELDAVGIDCSHTMIAIARRRRGHRLNVTFHRMEADDIKYPEGTFDAAAAVQTAHHWERVDAVLAEIFRVLKPGGRLYVYEADSGIEAVPEGWIERTGPWPPDRVLLRAWREHGMDEARWSELKDRVRASPFGGGADGRHGFYRRLVLTKPA